jgi:hypothetical protein
MKNEEGQKAEKGSGRRSASAPTSEMGGGGREPAESPLVVPGRAWKVRGVKGEVRTRVRTSNNQHLMKSESRGPKEETGGAGVRRNAEHYTRDACAPRGVPFKQI